MVAHPGRGQVGNDVVARAELVHLHATLGCADEAGMGLAHALGLAGGTGGVEDDADVLLLHALDGAVPDAGVVAVPGLAQFFQLGRADQARLGILAQAARVVVNDVAQGGYGFTHLQELVHLFLVFREGKLDVGILDDEGHFLCHSILVQGNGNGAQALHSSKADVHVGAVVADEGQVLAFGQAQCCQAAGHVAHVAGDIAPAPCLPDTVLFLTQRGCLGALTCVLQKQVWECGRHCSSSQKMFLGWLQTVARKKSCLRQISNNRSEGFDVIVSFQ